MIEFRLKALTARGKSVLTSFRQSQSGLRCYCGPGESCLVEITVMPDQRIDVIVRMPRSVSVRGEWRPYTVVQGMYGRRFDRGTSVERVYESIEQIIGSGSLHVSRESQGNGLSTELAHC